MRAYVITTGVLFGLLTIAHIWRVFSHERHLVTEPVFVAVTIITAALCVWAVFLLRRSKELR
jgi:hypothetical protein